MNLNINFEELEKVAGLVSQKGEEFQELLTKIKSINTELQAYWQGSDASKYSTAVANQAEQIQGLVTTIGEIGTYLLKVSNSYKEAMEHNMSGIRG